MRKIIHLSIGFSCYLLSLFVVAKEVSEDVKPSAQVISNEAPQVGRHVMANVDASSMILSLLMVLALIIVSAFLLKRFNLVQQGSSGLRVVTSLSLGAKERVVVVQVGEKQLLLGVTSQQVTLLDSLTEPLTESLSESKNLASTVPLNIATFLSKIKNNKTDKSV